MRKYKNILVRPWDKNRDGFVIAEGSGCVVIEEYEHAKARGATIYGEVIGYGMSRPFHKFENIS